MRKRGSIDQIANGRFRARMSVHGKQETLGFYDTWDEADRAIQVAVDVEKDTAKDFDGDTLEEFGRKILTRREVKKLIADPDTDWSRWNMHVKPDVIARLAIRRVRTDHLHRWILRLEDKGLGVSTIRNCRTLVSVVFGEAVREGIIRENPCRELRVRGGKKAADWTYLAPDEQLRLIGAFGETERHLVAAAIGCGVRAGELVTLRLADVHVGDDPRIVVRYGSPPDLPTKTRRIRTVPLFGLALAAIRSWLELLPEYCPDNPHGLLFPRPRGGFRSEAHVIKWAGWKAGRDAAKLGRRFRWHDLRHTCASSLVSGWWGRRWSLQEVKEMLGHTTIAVTQRYAHLAESAIAMAGAATLGAVSASQLLQRPALPVPATDAEELQGFVDGATHGNRTHDLRFTKTPLLPGSVRGNGPADELLTATPLWSDRAAPYVAGLLGGGGR